MHNFLKRALAGINEKNINGFRDAVYSGKIKDSGFEYLSGFRAGQWYLKHYNKEKKIKVVGSHAMNIKSSRSHAIFIILIIL